VVWCALACAAAAISALVLPAGYVRTEDHNGDGRADVWRTYDRDHHLLEVAVDTNFDGRSDVHEYYEREALVRRESDRDFNDRVDLVEEFDPATNQHVRSVVDVDSDGAADLLVLFQDGEAVFSTWADRGSPALSANVSSRMPLAVSRSGQDQLVPLEDPFRTETAVRAVAVSSSPGQWIGLSSSGGQTMHWRARFDSSREVLSPCRIVSRRHCDTAFNS